MSRDTTFGRLAVQQNYATQNDLKACYQIRQKLESMGIEPKPLEEIMLEKGIITSEQHQRILAILDREQSTLQIKGYEILEQIGTGGMGAVFRARQVSMDRIVALKVLPIHLAQDREFVKKFKKEAKTLAQLNHENIVGGLDIGESGGHHYFAMEHIEGKSLNDLLKEKTKLPEKIALDIALQMTQALSHIHKQQIIHCDIKPHNIMLTQNNMAKLCDLGLARKSGYRPENENQQAVGTPHYISPEQAKGTEEVDGRSDIYSLGATLYHFLVGEPPFSGSSPMVVMTKHLTDPVVPPIKRNPKISVALNSVIMKMMSKRKEDRYQNAEDLQQDLENIKEGKAFQVTGDSKSTTTFGGGRTRDFGKTEVPGYSRKNKNLSPTKGKLIGYRAKQERVSLAIFVLMILFLLGSGVYVLIKTSQEGAASNVNPGDNAQAWELLDEAASFKNLHPEDIEGAILRYRKVTERYPGTEAAKYAKRILDSLESN